MKNNNLDKFESFLKEGLDAHTEAYQPSSWDALEKKLSNPKIPFFKSPWFWGAAAIIGLAVPVIYYNTINTNAASHEDALNKDNTAVLVNTTPVDEADKTNANKGFDSSHSEANAHLSPHNNQSNTAVENNVLVDNKEPIAKNSGETKVPLTNSTDPNQKENSNTKVNEVADLGQKGEKANSVVIKVPTADINLSSSEICEGASVQFSTAKQTDVDYLWSFGDGKYSKDQNPKHTYLQTGTYTVSLIVRSTLDNSVLNKAVDQLVTVNPMPKVDFDTEIKENQGIPITSFINLSDRGVKWNWSTGDGSNYSSKEPEHLYYRKGKYNVSLLVENEFGCVKTVTKPIDVVDDFNLLAPAAFTPNGDGLNDVFIPEALKIMDVSFTMTIISINEGVIFETNSLSSPWNGNNQKTGAICSEGTYKWVVSYVNAQGKTEQFTGAILLLK